MNIPEVTKARAEVIEDFIQIEILLAGVISDYYIGKTNSFGIMFTLEVLYDENCSFGMKRNILEKILNAVFAEPDKKKEAQVQFQKLYKLNRIRNLFAHCGPDVFLAKNGRGVRIIPDPRNPVHPVDFDADYQEFKKLQPEVFVWLDTLRSQIDGLRPKGAQKFFSDLTSHIPGKL